VTGCKKCEFSGPSDEYFDRGGCDHSYRTQDRLIDLCTERGELWDGERLNHGGMTCVEIVYHILDKSQVIFKEEWLAMEL